MSTRVARSGRKIPVNVGDPPPLLLWEAIVHVGQGLPDVLRRPVGIAVCVIALGGVGAIAPATAGQLLAGALAAASLCGLIYLLWYSRFASLNATKGTLCPCCLSRMWQVCCVRCREPVPPLALMLNGILLPRCPHCNLVLSERGGTLLAWCSTCSHTQASPQRFYAKPTELTVWVDVALPSLPVNGYEVIVRDQNRLVLFDGEAPSGPALLIMRGGNPAGMAPVASHLLPRTSVLLLSAAIPETYRRQIAGFFDRGTPVKVVPPIRDLEMEARRSSSVSVSARHP